MRIEKYEKSQILEQTLISMNEKLAELEDSAIQSFKDSGKPIVFIVGAQRSGTTLLIQLLLRNFVFSYTNNFVARFWDSPYLGSVLFNSLNVLEDQKDWFNSDLGYTKGLQGPHEFGYFWKKYFPEFSYETVSEDQEFDLERLKKTIIAIQSLNDSAFLVKNLTICSFQIEKLKQVFPNSFFVYIDRDVRNVMRSTYKSRIKLFDSENEWFGLRPVEYNELKKLPVFEQIAGQIKYTKKHIEKDLDLLPLGSYCKINYENLVENTGEVLEFISSVFTNIGISQRNPELIVPDLKEHNNNNLSSENKVLLEEAYQKYFKGN